MGKREPKRKQTELVEASSMGQEEDLLSVDTPNITITNIHAFPKKHHFFKEFLKIISFENSLYDEKYR